MGLLCWWGVVVFCWWNLLCCLLCWWVVWRWRWGGVWWGIEISWEVLVFVMEFVWMWFFLSGMWVCVEWMFDVVVEGLWYLIYGFFCLMVYCGVVFIVVMFEVCVFEDFLRGESGFVGVSLWCSMLRIMVVLWLVVGLLCCCNWVFF